MARASIWPKVRSTCADVSFIARSFHDMCSGHATVAEPAARARLAEPPMGRHGRCRGGAYVAGTARSVFGLERNDDVPRLGCVGLQAIRIGPAPVGEIHDLRRLGYRPRGLGRLKDVEPITVEEKRVLPEQAVELPNHGVVVWNGIALKLSQSSLDLCGREFHRTLLLRSSLWIKLVSIELAAPTLRQRTTRGHSHHLVVKRGAGSSRARTVN